jgi:hypothetical protein
MLSVPPGSPRAWPRLGLRTKSRTTAEPTSAAQTLLAWTHLHASLKPNLRRSDCPQGLALPEPAFPRPIDAETWSAVRDQLAANTSRHQSRSNAAEPSLLAGLLVDARCPWRAPYYITRRQQRACRAGHRGRNGSRARLGRYAPSSGNVMCAPAVTLGATNGPTPRRV